MSGLTASIVTPDKHWNFDHITMIEVPGSEGVFGALPGHAPLICTLRAGFVTVYGDGGKIMQRYVVAGGFAEVRSDQCQVIADQAFSLDGDKIDGLNVKLKQRLGEIDDQESLAFTQTEAMLKFLNTP